MKKYILLLALFGAVLSATAQFASKQYFKHNEVDGWIKVTESEWFTINQKGDTTFFTQTYEETNQEDPNVKPKYEFDGLGNVVKSVPQKKPDVVQYVNYIERPAVVLHSVDTFSVTKYKMNTKYRAGTTGRTKWKKGKTVYRYRSPKVKAYAQPVKKKVKTSKVYVLTYKDNLYMVSAKYGDSLQYFKSKVIQGKTSNDAKLKFIKWFDKYDPLTALFEITAIDFDQYDIIK